MAIECIARSTYFSTKSNCKCTCARLCDSGQISHLTKKHAAHHLCAHTHRNWKTAAASDTQTQVVEYVGSSLGDGTRNELYRGVM